MKVDAAKLREWHDAAERALEGVRSRETAEAVEVLEALSADLLEAWVDQNLADARGQS